MHCHCKLPLSKYLCIAALPSCPATRLSASIFYNQGWQQKKLNNPPKKAQKNPPKTLVFGFFWAFWILASFNSRKIKIIKVLINNVHQFIKLMVCNDSC